MKGEAGFSLIELMITVVIISIVTSIALPNYQKHVLRSHRSDATVALLQIAAEQEKFYLQNNTYATTLTEIGVTVTAQNFYTLAIVSADTAQFSATASIDSNGPQDRDKDCIVYSINSAGSRSAVKAGGTDNSAYCWK